MRGASSSAIAGALMLAGMACGANASTVTFSEISWTSGSPNAPVLSIVPADSFTPLYTPSTTGSILPGVQRSPYEDNSGPSANTAYSVLSPGGNDPGGSSATYNLFGNTSFQFLWGSPDDYNHITFYDGAGGTGNVISITGAGTDINGSELACYVANNCNRLHWVFVTFLSDTPLGSVVLSDNGTAAFEFGLVQPNREVGTTPLPAAVWLFGTVVAGAFGGSRLRRRRKAA
jgi:hypothetical protein